MSWCQLEALVSVAETAPLRLQTRTWPIVGRGVGRESHDGGSEGHAVVVGGGMHTMTTAKRTLRACVQKPAQKRARAFMEVKREIVWRGSPSAEPFTGQDVYCRESRGDLFLVEREASLSPAWGSTSRLVSCSFAGVGEPVGT